MQENNSINVIERNGQLVVDSRLVAKELGIAHKNFKATIEKYQTEIEQDFGILPFETEEIKGRGQPEKINDPRFGKVNTYPEHILAEII